MRLVLGMMLFAPRFLWQVVISGLTTAWLIVRPGPRPTPALARMRFSGLDETGAAVLGSLITLTPGTTTIDIDLEKRELLLHLLDGSDAAGTVHGIRADLERPLQRIFAPRGAP
jgi:multicomponent K+:H+ antiporter subunit E/multicomponent Na+:H+ antiporter subunit E